MHTGPTHSNKNRSGGHQRLTQIAVIANALVWVVLAIFTLAAGARWITLQNQFAYQANMSFQPPDFTAELLGNPLHGMAVAADMLSIFVQGVIYALVLRGISLGLFMIVETDLNYRAPREEQAGQ